MKKIFLGILLSIALVGVTAKVLFAQSETGAPITVFPAIQEKLIRPNIKSRMQVQFKNNGIKQVTGKVKIADFVVNDKEGSPVLIEDSTSRPKYSAASWITPSDDQVTIPAGDFISVDLMVNPPAVISTCGRYAVVYIEIDSSFVPGKPSARDSASEITAKVGGLLNFTVEGQVCKHNLQVSAFTIPGFLEYGPIPVNFDLLNMGDVHVMPSGVVMIGDMLNRTVNQESIQQKSIFPETAKTYNSNLGSKWMLGRYKVSLLISREGNEGPIVVSKYLWVAPWRVMIFVILALILLAVAAKTFYSRTLEKEKVMEKEITREREEIDALKDQMRKRDE